MTLCIAVIGTSDQSCWLAEAVNFFFFFFFFFLCIIKYALLIAERSARPFASDELVLRLAAKLIPLQNPCRTHAETCRIVSAICSGDLPVLRNAVMSRSDADSTSNASAAVGAPSERRKWQHYHDVLDEQGKPIVSNNRKSRVCNYCGHEFKHLSLEQAVKHLDKCEEAQQQVDGLSALIDQVNLDRSAKKEKALIKSQQPARSRSILGKHARDSSQSTLDNRAKAIRVAPDEQNDHFLAQDSMFQAGYLIKYTSPCCAHL